MLAVMQYMERLTVPGNRAPTRPPLINAMFAVPYPRPNSPARLSKKEEDFLKEYIKKHLEKKFIRPLNSPIGHGVLFIPKKDRTL